MGMELATYHPSLHTLSAGPFGELCVTLHMAAHRWGTAPVHAEGCLCVCGILKRRGDGCPLRAPEGRGGKAAASAEREIYSGG